MPGCNDSASLATTNLRVIEFGADRSSVVSSLLKQSFNMIDILVTCALMFVVVCSVLKCLL
jgi:hypothetical protein